MGKKAGKDIEHEIAVNDWSWNAEMSDVFYFLDYARCLIELSKLQSHHVDGYNHVLSDHVWPLIFKILKTGIKLPSRHEFFDFDRELMSICSSIKDISNETMIMRALLRAEHELQNYLNDDTR